MDNAIRVPETARQRGKIAPAKLAHFVVRTSRYAEVIRWYQTVLEAEVMVGTPGATFLTYDDEHHRIAVLNMPGLVDKNPAAAGVDHCAFTYDSIEDLFITYERLRTLGIVPFWTVNHGATLSFYYADPDGNSIELQIDIFATNEEINGWMQQSDFEVNPIGVKFDADDLIARYRAGEDRAKLLTRPVIDPSEVFAQLPERP